MVAVTYWEEAFFFFLFLEREVTLISFTLFEVGHHLFLWRKKTKEDGRIQLKGRGFVSFLPLKYIVSA